ncbi:MAG: hypothetical protein OXM61_11460 [Candidatus Poribacteria bacterium]|nr:hypothetical protein [Candidatus Poribacteria bacterium]
MQDALTKHQNVISAEVSLPDQAIIKVRKNSVKVNELTNVIKTAGFTATAK